MITWLGCDLVTGQIIDELPDLRLSGSIARVLGTYQNASFTLPIPLPGLTVATRDWVGATEQGRSLIVAVVNDVPVWGGIALRRNGGTDGELSLNTVTVEGYLNRRYVGDHIWVNADQASVIAAGLIADAQVEGIDLTVDAPASGVLRDRSYFNKDNKTVFAVLDELSGVVDGPEWTIDLAWSDSTQTAVDKIARVRSRIGITSPSPSAVFETTAASVFDTDGKSGAEYTFDEDYSEGKGANHVVAYSSGEGDAQPFSDPARDEALLAAGFPRYEHRFQPSSSISDVATLNSHAQARLSAMRMGARTWAIEASASAYPLLGVDWNLGDDVAWDLVGHRHPAGVQEQGRAIGWNLSPDTDRVSLVLWDPNEEGAV
jgi:hypothetical protein